MSNLPPSTGMDFLTRNDGPDSENWLDSLSNGGMEYLTPRERMEADRHILNLTKPKVLDQLRADPANLFTLAGKSPDPWQAALLRSQSKRLLLLCSRQAGKSTTAAALALREAVSNDGSLVLLLSPTLRQSGELFRDKILRMYQDVGQPVVVDQLSALQMTLANGSRIVSLPGDEGTVRGYSGVALLIIDEASRVPDDLYRAVRPMIAVSGGSLMILSTPFGKRGFFYQEWHGTGDWERVRVTADQCPRIPKDFLEEERRAMGEEWYAQEYLCDFAAASGSPLYPSEWLDRSAKLAELVRGKRREAKAIGIDPGEGVANTAWAVVDEYGLMHLLSMKTPDTSVIRGRTVALMREYNVPPERVIFDRGGGGKQIADDMRADGYRVRTVAFGETLSMDPKRGLTLLEDRMEHKEERYAFRFRRDQMYWDLRQLLDPANGSDGFALPAEYAEIHRQLSPIPLRYDKEGRFTLPPKHKDRDDDKKPTLTDLIGHSPDEADALVLAIHGMLHKVKRATAGTLKV